jgi:hypothetical protein
MNRLRYALLLCGSIAWSQTQIDLRTQSKSVDFSSAATTKTAKTGAVVPATCSLGEIFFNTAAIAGSNIYACTATNTWTVEGGGAATPNYSKPFTAATSLSMAGAEHLLKTANLVVTCYDASTPARLIEPDSITVDPVTYNVTVTFAQPQSGRCVVNGNSISGTGGSGAVASVFGRTGGVIAQTGDYSFPQILGTVTNTQMAGGVDAAKIGTGAVSNTIFGYISNLTSDAQSQINSLTHAGGDLSGDPRSATVTGLQGRPVSAQAPSSQQALMWNPTAGTWQPQTLPVSGAQFTSQLLDLAATPNPTGTILTIGGGCSTATPCNVRFGNAVYAVTSPATAGLGSGAVGTAFIYITSDGGINVGSNMSITCSGCNSVAGVLSYPVNTIPIYTWTAVNGVWTTGIDNRAMLSTKLFQASTGLTVVDTGAQTTLGIDTAVVPTYVTANSSLNFGSISTGTCSAELTFSAPGALAGDNVAPGWPASLPAGVLGRMRITANGVAGVQLCNLSGAAVTVNATFQLAVVRSF